MINMDRQKIINEIRDYTEILFRQIFGWMSDNSVVIGFIIRIIHSMITLLIVNLIVISIFFPTFRLITFILLFLIWIQHIIFQCCILSICELKLLDDDFLTIITDIFGIPYSVGSFIFIIIETITVVVLGLLVFRIIAKP